MRANVKQAIAYLAALGVRVTNHDVVFNQDGEITFTCLRGSRELISALEKQAKSRTKWGYTKFDCASGGSVKVEGLLTIEAMGMLGCTVTLSNKS